MFRRVCVGSEDGIEVARYFFPESFIYMMSTVLLGWKSPCLAFND